MRLSMGRPQSECACAPSIMISATDPVNSSFRPAGALKWTMWLANVRPVHRMPPVAAVFGLCVETSRLRPSTRTCRTCPTNASFFSRVIPSWSASKACRRSFFKSSGTFSENAVAGALGYTQAAIYTEVRPGEIQRICLDCGLAQRELGWKAQVPLERGIADTVAYFKEKGI